MFVYLAQSGGRVVLPSVVAVQDGETPDDVAFVDDGGHVIAVFRRSDVATYSAHEIIESAETAKYLEEEHSTE